MQNLLGRRVGDGRASFSAEWGRGLFAASAGRDDAGQAKDEQKSSSCEEGMEHFSRAGNFLERLASV
jgi:hypothetical protein